MEWNPAVEQIFEELADESQLRNKLHYQQYRYYSNRNNHYTLPVVILSTLCGSGNFIAGQFPLVEKFLIIGIGAVSIITSIISAVSQFLKLAQLSENNRIAAIAWGKYYNSIKFEIRLRIEDRSDPKELLTSLVAEYSRLYEISPPLLNRFVDKMCKKLQGLVSDRFRVPFYMNGYRHCASFNEFDDNTEDEKLDPGDD